MDYVKFRKYNGNTLYSYNYITGEILETKIKPSGKEWGELQTISHEDFEYLTKAV